MEHMEEQDIKEAKRARNFIWMAACDYDIEPLFLAFAPDGTADIYLNLIIGLEYKWYEHDKIDALFNQLTGKNAMLYEGLLWIGLENALYEKERQTRPALYDLRLEYAKKSLAGVNKNREYSRIDIIRNAHCRRILGKPSGLCKEDEEILHAFCFTPDMTTDEIIEKTRVNLWKYFSYKPIKVAKPQGIYFLQKVAGAFHSIGKVSTQYVRANSFYDKNMASDTAALSMEHSKRYLLQFALQKDPIEAKRYVTACFGKSIYSDRQQAEMEKKLKTNKFTLQDFYDQMVQMKSMGSMEDILAQMPGGANLKGVKLDEKAMAHTEAIILSMTPKEREKPEIIGAGRKKRIAAGAGVRVEDVNKLLKSFEQMRKLIKQFSGPGAGKKLKRMGRFGGLGGGFPGF